VSDIRPIGLLVYNIEIKWIDVFKFKTLKRK